MFLIIFIFYILPIIGIMLILSYYTSLKYVILSWDKDDAFFILCPIINWITLYAVIHYKY